MDFRTVDASKATWSIWTRGQPAARLPSGSKVSVQTPTCACKASLAAPGMYRLEMQLRPDVRAHRAFADWVDALEECAADAPSLERWKGARRRSSSIYNNTMRLTAFSDTLAFDGEGKLSADVLDARGCAALIELQGLWATDAKWGLRWKIVQFKFTKEAPDLPPDVPAFLHDDEPGAAAPFAFLPDDL